MKFNHSAVSAFDNAFSRLLSISACFVARSITFVAVFFHQKKIQARRKKIHNMLTSVFPRSQAMAVNMSMDKRSLWCWSARCCLRLCSSTSERCFDANFSPSLIPISFSFPCIIWKRALFLITSLKTQSKSLSIGLLGRMFVLVWTQLLLIVLVQKFRSLRTAM